MGQYIRVFSGGSSSFSQTTNYRSSYESGYIYEGYLNQSNIYIVRNSGNTKNYASGLTDLESDWTNRASLTYI
jgi:hypothetical protein